MASGNGKRQWQRRQRLGNIFRQQVMATFLCKKCAHKTLPISITTFHFQFAVRSFPFMPRLKKRETLTGELCFERGLES